MDNLVNELLKILKTPTGQGNSNTSKLTEKVIESNSDLDYNKTKIEVVEALGELHNSGQIQIMTVNWELGEEFLYLDSFTEGKIDLV